MRLLAGLATLSTVAAALVVAPAIAQAQSQNDKCEITDWRYYQFASAVALEGTTTCRKGMLDIKAFGDNGEYIGKTSALVVANSFTTYILMASEPVDMSIEYETIQTE